MPSAGLLPAMGLCSRGDFILIKANRYFQAEHKYSGNHIGGVKQSRHIALWPLFSRARGFHLPELMAL